MLSFGGNSSLLHKAYVPKICVLQSVRSARAPRRGSEPAGQMYEKNAVLRKGGVPSGVPFRLHQDSPLKVHARICWDAALEVGELLLPPTSASASSASGLTCPKIFFWGRGLRRISMAEFILLMPNGSKYYCFTWNNPPDDIDVAINGIWESDHMSYCIYQHEIGANRTPHLQGYVIFKKRVAKPSRIFGGGHWESARGSPPQNRAYCSKEDTRAPDTVPREFGECPETAQGTRNDILEVKEKVDLGVPLIDIWDAHFQTMLRYSRGVSEYKRLKMTEQDFCTKVTVVIGPTGTGKSQWARAQDAKAYYKQKSDWWDGYDGHETVIMDDFYGWVAYDEMLRIMDRYPLMIQVKGGQTQFLAKHLIITSNEPPSRWYKKLYSVRPSALEAFSRRITSWIYMGSAGSFSASSAEEFDELSTRHVINLE